MIYHFMIVSIGMSSVFGMQPNNGQSPKQRFSPGQTVYVVQKSRPDGDNAFEYAHHREGVTVRQPIGYGGKQDKWVVRFGHETKRVPESELIPANEVDMNSVNDILSLDRLGTVVFDVRGKSDISGEQVEHNQKAYLCNNDDEIMLAWITRTKGCLVNFKDITEADWKNIKVPEHNSTYVKRMITLIRENPEERCPICLENFPELMARGATPIQLSCKNQWFCNTCLERQFRNASNNMWFDFKCPYQEYEGTVRRNCPTHDQKPLPAIDLEKWAQCVPGNQMTGWLKKQDIFRKTKMKKMNTKWHCRNPEEKWNREDGAVLPGSNEEPTLEKPCPSCGIMILRSGGCTHMECACGFQFCWLCGKKYIQATAGDQIPKGHCNLKCHHSKKQKMKFSAALGDIKGGKRKRRWRRKKKKAPVQRTTADEEKLDESSMPSSGSKRPTVQTKSRRRLLRLVAHEANNMAQA